MCVFAVLGAQLGATFQRLSMMREERWKLTFFSREKQLFIHEKKKKEKAHNEKKESSIFMCEQITLGVRLKIASVNHRIK